MPKNKAKIIATFGCLGKTYCAHRYPGAILDLESTLFEYQYDIDIRDIEKVKGMQHRKRNKNFPNNYIEAILEAYHRYSIILIVLAKEVLQELEERGIQYDIVYPHQDRISQLLSDAQKRGNNQKFIERLAKILATPDDMNKLKCTCHPQQFVLLHKDEYLDQYLEKAYPELIADFCYQDEPILHGKFTYHEVEYKTDFYDLKDEGLPDHKWMQVYLIGNYKNLVPVVKYKHSRNNLPGGGIKGNETIEQALQREAKEELNMTVTDWRPLGYQRVYDDNGNEGFQLRVYAELKKDGEFEKDPGGSVIGYELIPLEKLNEHIGYGEIGVICQPFLIHIF